MGIVLLDMAISLDGYVAGPNNADLGLYDWYMQPTGTATAVKDELFATIGAMILGHGAFGDDPSGFDTPYKVPHFVLSHTDRPPVSRDGVEFRFVDGIDHSLAQARAAAGSKTVCVAGGAQTARQFIAAGLLDEIHLHLVHLLAGDGLRLFEPGPAARNLERIAVIEGDGVTHLRFRVLR